MELRDLRAFIAVAETLHFGRAAQNLSISGPPLSRRIAELERKLGVRLFHRTKRRVRLSDPGRILLGEARTIVAHVDRMQDAARQAQRGEIGHLSVGAVAGSDFTRVPAMIRRFGRRYPSVRLELHGLPSPEQVAGLRDGWLHVGFLRAPIGDRALASDRILSEGVVIALPDGHRLARHRRVPRTALASEPAVLLRRERAPAFYDSLGAYCRDGGFALVARYEVDRLETIRALVAAGAGFALVPESVRALPYPGVTYCRLHPAPPRLDLLVAWRRDNQSPTLQSFLEMVRRD
jgi:DNA-binding transcriptional LysR family regulator